MNIAEAEKANELTGELIDIIRQQRLLINQTLDIILDYQNFLAEQIKIARENV